MPIKKGSTGIESIYKGTTAIVSVYKGYDLVYESWKTLTTQGMPPLTLSKCKNTNMLGYKVYGDSVQNGTPTPDAPIKIQSVGDIKNLWNSELQQGCRLFSNGVYYSSYSYYLVNKNPIPVVAGQTYTISAKDYTAYDAGFVLFNNGTFVSSAHAVEPYMTVTIPSGVNQLYYNFRKSGSPAITPTSIEEIQLEVGSTATSYEPYGYKIPVTVSGKNICNPNSFINTGKLLDGVNGGLNTNANYKTTDFIFIKAGTYTLSLDNTYDGTAATTTRMCLYNTSYGYTGNAVSDTSVRPTHPSYTFTVSNDCYYRLGVRNTDINIQLEKSGTETPYEPYVAPRTTNIYLDEPLRKIGNGEVKSLPVGYTQLDYLESSGTQYIDTGIILTNQDFVTINYSNSLNESYSIFGANDGTYRCQFFYNGRSRYTRNFTTVNEHMLISGQVEYGTADTYYLDLKNRKYKQGSGNWVTDTNDYQSTPQLSAFLFAQNNSGEASGIGTMRIYEYSVSRNGKEIQHLIPAKNSSDVIGMYDTISNTFLTNQGTGTFASKQSMYYDYIDLETQKVYRNVGYVDLGDLTYTYQSQYTRFRSSTITGIKVITGNWMYDLMSDVYGNTLAQNYNIGTQAGVGFIWDNRYTDDTDIKNALKGHYLIYALNAQAETAITLQDILLNKGTNIVSVGTSLTPNNIWIKYKGKQ